MKKVIDVIQIKSYLNSCCIMTSFVNPLRCAECDEELLLNMLLLKNYYCVRRNADSKFVHVCEDCHAPALQRGVQNMCLTMKMYTNVVVEQLNQAHLEADKESASLIYLYTCGTN